MIKHLTGRWADWARLQTNSILDRIMSVHSQVVTGRSSRGDGLLMLTQLAQQIGKIGFLHFLNSPLRGGNTYRIFSHHFHPHSRWHDHTPRVLVYTCHYCKRTGPYRNLKQQKFQQFILRRCIHEWLGNSQIRMPKEVVLRNKGRKSGAGIKANLLHCLSSLMSPQSFQPSHFNFWSMHRPLVQANRSGQAYPITHRKHGWVGGYSDKLSKTELCIFTRRVMLPMLAPVDQSNYKFILVKLGDNKEWRVLKVTCSWLTVTNKRESVNKLFSD